MNNVRISIQKNLLDAMTLANYCKTITITNVTEYMTDRVRNTIISHKSGKKSLASVFDGVHSSNLCWKYMSF